MRVHDALIDLLGTSRRVISTYLSDLSNKDLMVRPIEGAHHAAWQIGHLIISEREMMEGVQAGSGLALPKSFEEMHGEDNGDLKMESCCSKVEYEELMSEQRSLTLALLADLSEHDLEQPAPDFMRSYASSVLSVFVAIGSHEMMHAGQIAVIRRKLNKPVLI